MSDFCIYPHSGIPQWLKGLILGKEPFKRTLVQDSPVGRRPEPAQPEVTWPLPPLISFFHNSPPLALLGFRKGYSGPSSASRIHEEPIEILQDRILYVYCLWSRFFRSILKINNYDLTSGSAFFVLLLVVHVILLLTLACTLYIYIHVLLLLNKQLVHVTHRDIFDTQNESTCALVW
jgi:hypothetical protein